MRPLIILVTCISLAACGPRETGIAPAVQLPPMPVSLAQKATPLPSNQDTSVQAQVLDNTNSITSYNRVGIQLNNLIDYFNCVKTAINEKKELKCQ